jgi:hypothetical protein
MKIGNKELDVESYDECYIIGGGPSLVHFDWKTLDGKFVLGINRAYEVLPDAQVIYFTDKDYYERHKDGMHKHGAVLLRGRLTKKPEIKHEDVFEYQLIGEKGLAEKPGQLYHGINSAYAAINVAYQMGFKMIYLLGIDMLHKGKYRSHWHSGHKRIDPPSIFPRFMKNHDHLAKLLKKKKVKVINVNSNTKLKAYPVKTYAEVFGPCMKKPKGPTPQVQKPEVTPSRRKDRGG